MTQTRLAEEEDNPRTELAPNATHRVTKVEDNVVIDEAKFAKPAAR